MKMCFPPDKSSPPPIMWKIHLEKCIEKSRATSGKKSLRNFFESQAQTIYAPSTQCANRHRPVPVIFLLFSTVISILRAKIEFCPILKIWVVPREKLDPVQPAAGDSKAVD